MFSDAISSTSCRWRPSSPLIAAAISGSASASVAVKNESGADAVLELEEAVMGRNISTAAGPWRATRSAMCGGRKKFLRDTTSTGVGQALAGQGWYLCQIWWGGRGSVAPGLTRGPYPPAV